MKQFIISFSVLLLLQLPMVMEKSSDLSILAEIINNEGITIEEWEAVVYMDEFSIIQFEKMKNKLENRYFVTIINDDNAIKYIFREKENHQVISHSFYAIVPTRNDRNVTFQLIISGTVWNKNTEEQLSTLKNEIQNNYFIKITKSFTCLKFKDSGIIHNRFLNEEFWHKLKILHKTEQLDRMETTIYDKTIYGYSPTLQQEIQVNNEKINVQMVIKSVENNKKQVIIGTPIILNEY